MEGGRGSGRQHRTGYASCPFRTIGAVDVTTTTGERRAAYTCRRYGSADFSAYSAQTAGAGRHLPVLAGHRWTGATVGGAWLVGVNPQVSNGMRRLWGGWGTML